MPTVVYILGVIFLGIMGITYIDNMMKIQKEKLKGVDDSKLGEMLQELQDVKHENAELRKRIENLEAIVVEEDMKLMTGLNDTKEENSVSDERDKNSEVEF